MSASARITPGLHHATQGQQIVLPPCNGQNSLWDLIRSNQDLAFVALLADVGNTNISTVLASPEGNYTVFVSTNEAVADYMSAVYGVSSTITFALTVYLSFFVSIIGWMPSQQKCPQIRHCKRWRSNRSCNPRQTRSSYPT